MKRLIAVLAFILVVAFGSYFLVRSEAPALSLGASVGPDLIGFNPYSWNNVGSYYYNTKFRTGTTTPCDIIAPNATTTLGVFTANVTAGTSTATIIGLYRSSSPNATTSLLAQLSPASGALATLVATTTTPGLTDKIVAPNSHLVFSVSGGGGVSNDLGYCNLKLDRV